MWYDFALKDGTNIRVNLYSFTDGYFRGVDEQGNDFVVAFNQVVKYMLSWGNNDYYGYSSTEGGDVGLGYG